MKQVEMKIFSLRHRFIHEQHAIVEFLEDRHDSNSIDSTSISFTYLLRNNWYSRVKELILNQTKDSNEINQRRSTNAFALIRLTQFWIFCFPCLLMKAFLFFCPGFIVDIQITRDHSRRTRVKFIDAYRLMTKIRSLISFYWEEIKRISILENQANELRLVD